MLECGGDPMTFKGRVRKGAVVLDHPAHLPEGAAVEVSVLGDQQHAVSGQCGDAELELPAGALDLQSRHGLAPYLPLAARFARAAFAPLRDLQFEVDVDPDTDERRLVLNVTVDAP